MRLKFYGKLRAPVANFIEKLQTMDRAKVTACLQCVQELGFNCLRVEFRQLSGKLWELKIKGLDSDYRILYVSLNKSVMVLLHAYKKQTQKLPLKELEIATKRLMQVLKDENLYTR